MKSIILVIFALITFNCYSQSWPKAETTKAVYDKWIVQNGNFFKMRQLSPVSISETIEETKDLLELINADYDEPNIDKSIYYREEAKETTDLSSFYVDVSIDFSRILKTWYGQDKTGKKYYIMLSVTKDNAAIVFSNNNPYNK